MARKEIGQNELSANIFLELIKKGENEITPNEMTDCMSYFNRASKNSHIHKFMIEDFNNFILRYEDYLEINGKAVVLEHGARLGAYWMSKISFVRKNELIKKLEESTRQYPDFDDEAKAVLNCALNDVLNKRVKEDNLIK